MKRPKFTFFFSWSIAFLLITIIGFVPTFLLRSVFRETSLPAYLIIHGVVMLIWFGGYFYQNLLVSTERTAQHRKLGMYLFLLAVLMSIANLNVVINISNEIVLGAPTYYGELRTWMAHVFSRSGSGYQGKWKLCLLRHNPESPESRVPQRLLGMW